MTPIRLGGVLLGQGRPKICVPLSGGNRKDLLAELLAVKATEADFVEWRADAFADEEDLLPTARALRAAAGQLPVLFTFRTVREGGQREINPQRYINLNCHMAAEGAVDALDMELSSGDSAVRTVLEAAHKHGVVAVISSHHFEATPPKQEMLAQLEHMRALGADVPKLAAMPHNFADVLALMDAVNTYIQTADCPVIAMAMGELGRISRVAGQFYGSAVSFGSLGQPSAPGQLPVAQLAAVLDILQQ